MSYNDLKEKLYKQIGSTPPQNQSSPATSGASSTVQMPGSQGGSGGYDDLRKSLYKQIGVKAPTRSTGKDNSVAEREMARYSASVWERRFRNLTNEIYNLGASDERRQKFRALQSEYTGIATRLGKDDIVSFAKLGETMTNVQKYLDATYVQPVDNSKRPTAAEQRGVVAEQKARASKQVAPEYSDLLQQSGFSSAAKSGWDMYVADREATAEDRRAAEEWLSKPHFGVSAMEMATMRLATDDSYKQPDERWTQEQRNVFGMLYASDKAKAEQFAIDTNNAYNSAEQEKQQFGVASFAEDHPVIATAGSILGDAMGLGMADFLTSGIEKFARGTITQRGFVSPHQAAETATSTTAQNLNDTYGTISESVPVLGGRGLGDAYQIMNSIITSALTVNTSGAIGTDLIFFGNAASSAMDDAKSRNASDEQALLMGLISGAAEAAGEHFSATHLLGMSNPKTLSKFFSSMLGQALSEGEEEFFTSFMNNLADNYVMQDKSQFYVIVDEYKREHPEASDEEASKAAWKKMWNDMAFDFVGGTVSGGVHAGLQTAGMKLMGADNYHNIDNSETQNPGSENSEANAEQDNALDPIDQTDAHADDAEAADTFDTPEDVQRDTSDTLHDTSDTQRDTEADTQAITQEPALQEAAQETSVQEEAPATLEALSEKYGDYGEAMRRNYLDGQNVEEYDRAFQIAYDMGKSGLNKAALGRVEAISGITESQREIAYEIGEAAARAQAKAQSQKNAQNANGKTGWHKGVVRGEGVKIADLTAAFNDPQKKAYSALSTIAEATGIDVVLFKSSENAKGEFEGEQGRFRWSEDAIYIDVNAGLKYSKDVTDVAKYTMLRTYGHEFTHFIEKWSPEQYNDFRKAVFSTMENAEDLIETRLAQDTTGKLTYDLASREVVAEAMTDILEDSSFIQELSAKHPTVFDTLKSKLKEFVANLKSYFKSISGSSSREARMLKKEIGDSISYMENIVKMFDAAAVNAVENYQRTVAEDTVSAAKDASKEASRQSEEPKTPKNDSKSKEESQKIAKDSKESAKDSQKLAEDSKELAQETKELAEESKEFAQESNPSPATAYDGFSIRENAERGTLEITFDAMPSAAVREALKANKFRWSSKNKLWYGKGDEAHIAEIIQNADAISAQEVTPEKVPEAAAPAAASETADTPDESVNNLHDSEKDAETAADTKDGNNPYERLRSLLMFVYTNRGTTAFKESKLEFSVIPPISETDTWGYEIRRKPEYPANGIPIFNARDVISHGRGFQTREAAVDEIVAIAENNKLLGRSGADTSDPSEAANATKADNDSRTPSERLAERIVQDYLSQKKLMSAKELYAIADEAFGGTQAEGAYNRKDAYDAMELAVNKYLLTAAKEFNGNRETAVEAVEYMQGILELLPTQNVRTQEQQDFQQFSTPPNIAYLAAWSANITENDSVLEPSAGIGGLAVFAKSWGAEVTVNELSKRRLEVLRSMGFDHIFNENAEQIDNILPDSVSPSVVIMNPPFSSTAGRTKNNKTSNAEKHIDQALARLREGGRLVAILGKGMNDADYYKYWDKLRKGYNIRANLSIDGDNYKKYGTTWGVQIVVIDKTGPQTGETVTGKFSDLTEVPAILEGIRNDRSSVEKIGSASSGNSVGEPLADGRNDGVSDIGHQGGSERDSGSASRTERKKDRKVSSATERGTDAVGGERNAEAGTETAGSQDGGGDRADGRSDSGNRSGADEHGASNDGESQLSQSGLSEQEETSDDGVYAAFVLPDIPVKGSRKHPAVLVESAAMAAVPMPKAGYTPSLPENVVKNNLSDAQMVTVTYAGQAHEQKLPDGRRRGFFIGDGTGVGKGRQIAGIILDNFMQGRDKAVWISKNNDLYGDAVRDWVNTTGRSKDEVVNHGKFKPKDSIALKNGILFTTYDRLKMEKGGNRLDQIVQWVGEDFDGVIAFDEAHFMGNLFGRKGKFRKGDGSLTAKAGVDLQRKLPNARIVYVSATAATEVDNLAYAERLGLWGQGTAFANAQDFISKIGSSGLAAMELVIRDMKAMGSYVARSISYNGVNYDTVEHTLDPMQTEIYDTMSRAWQKTMSNVQTALNTTGGKYNSTERQRAIGNFYSSMQRFYNQVLTSMAMPSVIADMRKELAAGHSCVMQIVNTNEAQQNKQLAEAKASGESLDNLDMTPREALIGYLNTSFPTQLFEEYTDDDGNLRSRPVIDSMGNPVQSKEAIRQRDALIAEVSQMSIPDGPLEMLFDAFGTEAVAENTGRSRRVVPKKQEDGSVTRVEERRTLNHRTADVQAFQDGKKRILVFSDAGGTGKSYHADRSEKNQQLRVHYVLQPGWVASNAVQGFGRTHRSNEVLPPVYKLVTTNIKGQKRFTSTIARRLDQLGALTKGQRDTGSGMFGAKDNLETDLAKDSLREFYKRLGKNQIDGVDGMKTLDRLGLKQKFTDDYGAFKLNDMLARDISTFLNRILSLEVDEQNTVFDSFISIYEMELEAAIQAGTLDTGMENVKADKIEVVDDKVIREDKNSGAATHYIQAKTYTKPKIVTTVAEISTMRTGFEGLYRTESGSVKAVFRIADKTTEWGAIRKQYRLIGPNLGAKISVWGEDTLKNKATAIEKADWQKEWYSEVAKVPEYNEDTVHMLTGALLPIWNNLPQEGSTKVKRLIAEDGSIYLGRVIGKDVIDGVLKGFSIGRTMEVFTGKQVMDQALQKGVRFQLTNEKVQIYRSRVSGEWRLEIYQPYNSWYLARRYPGIIQERISYRDRFFIPVGEKGLPILDKLLKDNPVRSTMDEELEQYQSREYLEDDKNESERVHDHAGENTAAGLDRETSYGEGGRDSSQMAGEESWEKLGSEKQSEIEKLIDLYASFSNEGELYIGHEDGATLKAAKEFYIAMRGNRTLLENDGRFGWLGDTIGLLMHDVESIENGTYQPDLDFDDEYQLRNEVLSDREVLARAAHNFSMVDMSDAERSALEIFRDRLSKLEDLQQKRVELGKLYREQQFGKNVDRAAAAETLDKMHAMDARIREANDKMLEVEEKSVLRGVLKQARKVVENTQKAKDDEVLRRWRDRRNNADAIKKYRKRITKDVKDISDWVINPSNKTDMKHVPDVLKNTVIPFITSIDFTSKRQLRGGDATKADAEFMKRVKALQAALRNNIKENGLYSGYNDLPPDFMERIQRFVDAAQSIVDRGSGEFVINQMTAQEMKELSSIVSSLKKHIQDFNRFHANAVFQHVYEAGDATIKELNAYDGAKSRSKTGEAMNNFVFWQQIRPAYAFERFGAGGKAIYDGLRRGQGKLAFNTKEIVDFAENTYTTEEVREWEKEVHSVQIGGRTVQMKTTQIMSFYELLKREQAKGHIFGQGVRFATFRDSKNNKVSDTGSMIDMEDANRIISVLTDRQIAVADQLQKFMQEKGGEWGNFVSMKRFGEELFGEENYFPINSDGRHLETNADENPSAASLYALLNMGFTKKLQEKANNRIVLHSIFDVFSNHMAGMAQYNSMALPVLDALKWFNYQQKSKVTLEDGFTVINEVTDSVRDQLDRVFGVPEETRPGGGKRGYAENFVIGILKAFNGTETQGISSDSAGLNALRQYNMAQVAYNLRVVIQQPLAITRAAMVIDYASIIRGLRLSPKALQRNIDEMQRHSGIAAWKSLGFYDTNISRGLTDIIKHNMTVRDWIGEIGMAGAEKADQVTWAAMWSACKEEVQRKHGIKPGDEHFFEAVTSLFEEVVYKTQVVDSVLTKNEYLRSKGFFSRATGSFMSEPTTTASMVVDAYDKYRMDLQKRGATKRSAWEANRKNIGRTVCVYSVGAILLAAAQAVADAFRDDDKYEEYGDKWMEAFIGNVIDELMPFNKLPLIGDFYDMAKELASVFGVDTYGNAPSSAWMQWYDSLIKGTEILWKYIKGDGDKTNYTLYGGGFKLLQAASGMTGYPAAPAIREIIAAWNNTAGQMVPSLLVRSYAQKPETKIKYTFLDGNMTAEAARQALVRDAGFTAADADKKVAVYQYQRDNRAYSEMSDASVAQYLEHCQSKYVPASVFFDIWNVKVNTPADKDKDGKTIQDSARKKVLDYVDDQDLTTAQKDAIYRALGYSEKELYKAAPWH